MKLKLSKFSVWNLFFLKLIVIKLVVLVLLIEAMLLKLICAKLFLSKMVMEETKRTKFNSAAEKEVVKQEAEPKQGYSQATCCSERYW